MSNDLSSAPEGPSGPRANILLVDDQPANLVALEAVLAGLGQNLVKAQSGEEALRFLDGQDFAVVLLDVQMYGLDGFATATLGTNADHFPDGPRGGGPRTGRRTGDSAGRLTENSREM
jgi:PleD family two-component response regulator